LGISGTFLQTDAISFIQQCQSSEGKLKRKPKGNPENNPLISYFFNPPLDSYGKECCCLYVHCSVPLC